MLHKQFNENVIEQDTNHYQHEIPEQLNPSPQVRIRKNNIAHQEKSQRESDAEGDDESAYMRTDSAKGKLNDTFIKNEIVTDEINEYIQNGITTATGEVAKSFYIHYLLKRRIKEVNDTGNYILHVNWA